MLLDTIRERVAGPDQTNLIHQQFIKHQPVIVAVESVQYQLALVQDLLRRGLPAKAIHPRGDKVARAQLAAARFAAGTTYLPGKADWLTDYEDELLLFPNAKHDDMVDMTSMAINEVASISVPAVY